jgi:hypothetical protein
MNNQKSPMNEKLAAQHSLLAAARRVSESLPAFTTWLLAGTGAAFSLVVANIDQVSKFIEITHIRFGLVIFLISLGIAVVTTYFSTIINAALATQEDTEALAKRINSSSEPFDVAIYINEYKRGLLPHIRWISQSSMEKAKNGDVVAGARLIAKLSQIQALLVVVHSLLTLIAIGGLVIGLKMQ